MAKGLHERFSLTLQRNFLKQTKNGKSCEFQNAVVLHLLR